MSKILFDPAEIAKRCVDVPVEFAERCIKEAELYSRKNHDYSAGGSPNGGFERPAKIMSLYPAFPFDTPAGVAILYALKQLDAVMWGLARNVEHKVESYEERCADISLYFKIIPQLIKEGK